MEDRLPAVLEEAVRVRAEMGYPIMATPFSQLVGIQALLNVVQGERYLTIPDENLMYLAGHYGPPPGELDPEVLDRAAATERGRAMFGDWAPPQPSLAEIRARLRRAPLRRGAPAALPHPRPGRRRDVRRRPPDRAGLSARRPERARVARATSWRARRRARSPPRAAASPSRCGADRTEAANRRRTDGTLRRQDRHRDRRGRRDRAQPLAAAGPRRRARAGGRSRPGAASTRRSRRSRRRAERLAATSPT